jgi:hypothetical protein
MLQEFYRPVNLNWFGGAASSAFNVLRLAGKCRHLMAMRQAALDAETADGSHCSKDNDFRLRLLCGAAA